MLRLIVACGAMGGSMAGARLLCVWSQDMLAGKLAALSLTLACGGVVFIAVQLLTRSQDCREMLDLFRRKKAS